MLRLTRSALNALRAHGEVAYPLECCGVLLGRGTPDGWTVERVVATRNARHSDAGSRYEIAPKELVGILQEARSLNLEIAGFYHSHPDHPAHWSPTDLAEAHWLGCCYVITAVDQGKACATRCFVLAGSVEEQKSFAEWSIETAAERNE